MSYCEKCGFQLTSEDRYCPQCGIESPDETSQKELFCPKCKKRILPEDTFCFECGQRLNPTSEAIPSSQPKSTGRPFNQNGTGTPIAENTPLQRSVGYNEAPRIKESVTQRESWQFYHKPKKSSNLRMIMLIIILVIILGIIAALAIFHYNSNLGDKTPVEKKSEAPLTLTTMENIKAAMYHLNKGCEEYEQGMFDQAIINFTKVISIDPKFARAYRERGRAFAGKGLLDQAMPDYNKAIEINPKYAHAYISRGAAQYQLGSYEQAISDLDKAIEMDPNIAAAYVTRGAIFQSKNLYEKAISDFTKAIEIEPRAWDAYNSRGTTQYLLKQYDQAITDFDKALEIAPTKAVVYYNKATTCDKAGRANDALIAYKAFIEYSGASDSPDLVTAKEKILQLESTSPNQTSPINPEVSTSNYDKVERQIINNEVINGTELNQLTKDELRLLRNTIFARHGRTFVEAQLQYYYSQKPWYKINPDYNESLLTEVDKTNADAIKAAEKASPESSTGQLFSLKATIDDPDGYTYVRAMKSASSAIVATVFNNEEFLTYKQAEDWWQIKTKDGKVGYMHSSRIKIK